MAISHEPEKVTIDDFVVIKPSESYTAAIQTTVFASTDPEHPLHSPGKYWIQLGVDARPDEFYFGGGKKNFQRKWRSRGRILDFLLTEPFPVEIRLDPNAPVCTD